MDLLYLMPGKGMPLEEIERRTKVANSIADSSTNVTVMEVGVGPLSIESAIEKHMGIGPMLKKMLEFREEENYDAIIIGCAGDPGLRPARELLDIPIIGPAESSYHFACMISDRFSILSTMRADVASEDWIRQRVRQMGLESHLASVEFIQSSVVDLWGGNRDGPIGELTKAIEQAKKKGAGSAVFGCMSMAFLLVDEILENVGLPVINPLKTAIKTAEMFVKLGAKHSRITYPAADFEKLLKTVFS